MTKERKSKPKKREKFIVNKFYHYAEEYRKFPTEESEIEKIDMTHEFYEELDNIWENGELMNMNINAPPTSGKSTVAMAIANRQMKKHYKRKLGILDIDRDQQEFSKTMKNPKIKNTIRVIDEWNELESTGENSSVEQALYNYFSDVMAQRFVHKISCSPSESPDKNALIYLEVFSTNKVKKITYCKLFYKVTSPEGTYRQILGTVSIDVKEILEEKWYQEYRRRKFEKMSLILEHGIFRPRLLEYAEVIYEVVAKLRKLTRLSRLINNNIVRNYVKIEFKQKKIPLSIIGEQLATQEAGGILDLWKSFNKINKDINANERATQIARNKGETAIATQLLNENRNLEEMRTEIESAIGNQMEELENYMKINKEYNTVQQDGMEKNKTTKKRKTVKKH